MSVENFDTESFIEIIRNRPCLWDVTSDEYSNKTLKKHCWNEVFCTFIEEFENLPQDVKEKKSVDMQRRWKSLRNSFSRELAKQKNIKNGSGAANRKQYVYFDLLSFLMPSITCKTTTSSLNIEVEETPIVATTDGIPEEQNIRKQSRKRGADTQEALTKLNETLMESLKYRSNPINKDDDMLFLMSLHTHLKTVPQEQKLFAKLEIMQVLARYNKHTSPSQPSTSSQQFPTISFQNYQSLYHPSHNFHSNSQAIIQNQNPSFANSPNSSVVDSEDSSNFSSYSLNP